MSSKKCVPKGKKSKKFYLAVIFLIISGGYYVLILASLNPKLPSSDKPLKLYSNQLRMDLKQTMLQAIKKAKSSITLQIYGLTDPDLINLLQKKSHQGLDVKIFYDKKASGSLKNLQAYPVICTGLMHRKILVIDHRFVFLGTANFTTQSLKMHDNLILGVCDTSFAKFFEESIEETKNFEINGTKINSFLLPDFKGKALDQLISSIENATYRIQIAMFTLTHPLLIQKLIEAHQRGVLIQVAIDYYTSLGASKKAIAALRKAGIDIYISQGMQLLHHKWARIDRSTLVIGSANWTASAFKKNQDVMLILTSLNPKEQKFLNRLWKKIEISSQKE